MLLAIHCYALYICVVDIFARHICCPKNSIKAIVNKCYRILKGQPKMDNPKKLPTQGEKKKKTKDTTQYVSDTAMWKQTQRM